MFPFLSLCPMIFWLHGTQGQLPRSSEKPGDLGILIGVELEFGFSPSEEQTRLPGRAAVPLPLSQLSGAELCPLPWKASAFTLNIQ